jgi:hypothetical protein
MAKAMGIIQFPSFHAAVALIFTYTSRVIRILFPVSAGLNALMVFFDSHLWRASSLGR